jgi:hypothetical protein
MTRIKWSCALLLAVAGACSGQSNGGSPFDGGASGVEGGADTQAPTFAGAKSAKALGETQIAVTWDPATDPRTPQASIVYRVYVGLTSGGENFASPMLASPAGATGATLAGLHAYTSYFIVVRAVDEAGNEDSNRHEVTAMTTDTTPPTFAGAQSVVGTSASTALVSWKAATDIGSSPENIHYAVYASETQGGENYATPTVITLPGATSVTITGLTEAMPVYVVVRAIDQAGNEDSNRHEVEGVTLDTTPPTFAGVVSATAAGTAIALTWASATDAFYLSSSLVYEIYMATSPGGENFNKPSFTSSAGVTSFPVLNRKISTTYYFVVRARDPAGNEDTNKVEKSATTADRSDITPPTFGGVTSVTGLTDLTLQVSWVAATDPVTPQSSIVYDIFVANVTGKENFQSPSYTSAAGATSFTIPDLAPLTTLYVVVRARDQAGNEDTNTVEKNGTTLQDNPPTFTGASSVNNINYDTATVNWPAATDDYTTAANMRYVVCVTGTSGGCNGSSFVALAGTPVTGMLSFGLTGLLPVTTYYVVVRAENQTNIFNTTDTQLPFTTIQDPNPPTFTGITSATASGPTTIQLTWGAATDDYTPAANIVYDVYGGGGPGTVTETTPIASVTGTLGYTITTASPGEDQCYVVLAVNQAGIKSTTITQVCATTPDTGPGFTSGPAVSSPTNTSLTLTWAAASTPPGATITYLVCYSTTNGVCNTYPGTGTWTAATSPDVFSGLTPNTTYYFVVRATDSTASVLSGQVQGTTTAPPAFTTQPTVTATTTTTATLSWVATSVPAGTALTYEYCLSTTDAACTPTTAFTPTAGSPSTYTVTGLTSHTTYYFVIEASDPSGSTLSNIAGGTTAVIGPTLNSVSCAGPLLAGAYASNTGQSWPTYVQASTNVTLGSLPIGTYEYCVSTSATGCSTFTSMYSCTASGTCSGTNQWLGAAPTYVTAPTPNPGSYGTIGALTPDTGYYVWAVVLDTLGNPSAAVRSPAPTASSCTTAVSFTEDIYNFFGGPTGASGFGCNECHCGISGCGLPGPWAPTFNFQTEPVSVDGNTCGSLDASGWEFVDPNSTGLSLIYGKMGGTQVCGGSQMPPGGPFASAAQLALVALWINQGADPSQ